MNWICSHWYLWVIGVLLVIPSIFGFLVGMAGIHDNSPGNGWVIAVLFSIFGFIVAGISKILLILSLIIWIVQMLK